MNIIFKNYLKFTTQTEPDKMFPKRKEEWIEKNFKNKIPKMDLKKNFVPSPKELFF